MSAVFEHYRVSTVGRELNTCLEELKENNTLEEKEAEIIFHNFDKAITNALINTVKTKATIRGPMHHYRNHDDIWTFMLKSITLKIENAVTVQSDERTESLSVSKR